MKAIAYSIDKGFNKLEGMIRIMIQGNGISYCAINSNGYIALVEIEKNNLDSLYTKEELDDDIYWTATSDNGIKYITNANKISEIPVKELMKIIEEADLRNGSEGMIIYGALHNKIIIMQSIIDKKEYDNLIMWLKERINKSSDDKCIYYIGMVLQNGQVDLNKYIHKIKSDKYKYMMIRDWKLSRSVKEKIIDTMSDERWIYEVFSLNVLNNKKVKKIIKNKMRKDGLVLSIMNKYTKFTRRELEQLGRELNTEDPWGKLEEIRIMLNAWKRST
ncbi:MAG: hypothetical protein ABIM30_00405 [candidate division WOR-3 bacterium]